MPSNFFRYRLLPGLGRLSVMSSLFSIVIFEKGSLYSTQVITLHTFNLSTFLKPSWCNLILST